MDELEILIQAILSLKDTTKSKQQILSELPKLQQQLQSDKNAKINIVAGLDVNKSKSLIQSQLNTLTSQAKAPTIKVGVDVGSVVANDIKEISSVSKTVSDTMVRNFRDSFGITKRLSQETKAEIKSTLQDISNAWDSGDIDKYSDSIQRIMELAGKNGIKIISPETQNAIQKLESFLSDGSKVYIGEKLHQDLQYSLGDAKEVKAVLSTVYGTGKWTFNQSKGGIAADTIANSNYIKQYNGLSEAIINVYNNIKKLQTASSGTVFDNMSTQMAQNEIEDLVRSILKLNNETSKLSYISGVGVFENIGSVKEYNQEIQKTATIQSKLSNRNYASDNSAFIEQIKTLENEKTAVDNLVAAFNNYGIAVKNATSTKALDSSGDLNNLTVSITSKTGEIESFKYAAQEANGQTVLMLQNITATDNAVQRLVQSQVQYNDQLNASATKLQTQLDKIKSSAYTGGSKPIDFSGNEKLIQQWNAAQEAIEQMKSADKSAMASMKANAEAEISRLKLMVAEIKNAEYAATELRSRDIGNIKDVQTGNLDKFINQINNSIVPIQMLEQDIDNLRVGLSNISKENPKSLTEFLNQFDVAKSKFSSFKEFFKSVGMYNNELDKMASAWKKQGVYTDELKSKITALKAELSQISASGNTTELTKWIENYNQMSIQMGVNSEKQAQLNSYLAEQLRIKKDILSYQVQIANLENNPNKASKVAELQSIVAKRQEELSILQQETFETTKLMTVDEQKEYLLKNTVKEQERLAVAEKNALDIEQRSLTIAQQKADRLKAQIANYEAINSKAAKEYKSEFDSLKSGLSSANTSEEITKLQTQFATLKSTIKVAGKEGQTFFQKMIDGAKKFSSWMSLTTIISAVVRDVRKMVTNVVELDSAMTNLKKVTDETGTTYNKFFKNTAQQAKDLKIDLADLINQTAEWAKKGYDISQSSIASKASGIYSVVGEVDNATAVQDLTTVIKSYNMTIDESIDIVDKFNNISNKYSVNAADIGQMLSNSISSLSVAGNSLDEAIAMGSTITEITGDASEAGNTLKVLSMRLRGASTEIEQIGESTDGMAESTSKLREKILALTNVTGKGGFDIMADADNFKSTYEIMEGISKVWKDMSDVNQASLIEIIAGKQRGNTVSTLLTNMAQANNILNDSLNSSGSAMEEYSLYLESIEGRIQGMKTSFESLSNTVVNSGFIKGSIDFLTGGINLLDTVIDKFGTIQTLISAIALGTSLKNVGELYQNTPSYAPLPYCA